MLNENSCTTLQFWLRFFSDNKASCTAMSVSPMRLYICVDKVFSSMGQLNKNTPAISWTSTSFLFVPKTIECDNRKGFGCHIVWQLARTATLNREFISYFNRELNALGAMKLSWRTSRIHCFPISFVNSRFLDMHSS